LVVCLGTSEQILFHYLDAKSDLAVQLPSGMVSFSLTSAGYRQVGNPAGTISFSFDDSVTQVYDMRGQNGMAYVFAVPGAVDMHSYLPGDQRDTKVFQASSNVVSKDFFF